MTQTQTPAFCGWLDEHTGHTWAYAPKFRPPMAGFTCPRDGYLVRLDTDPAASRDGCPHGVIYYSRPLTPAEIDGYELRPL